MFMLNHSTRNIRGRKPKAKTSTPSKARVVSNAARDDDRKTPEQR